MGTKSAGSGLRKLSPGEILFNDGEKASSLYIIQNGQLRLFKPKGKGFIEIAVLRAGEVIGEMAYFDEAGGGKRSCSASAMVTSDVIEISFTAFSKTMSALNPWFKTIINTLANRLRQTNSRVKELESNSATVNYGSGKHSGYEFFKSADVIKVLGTLFLVYKGHGEDHEDGLALHRKTLNLYSHEIFGIVESKLDEMIIILEDLGLIKTVADDSGLPQIYVITDLNRLRSSFIFYNTEKHLTDDKKLSVSSKCQIFLEHIWQKVESMPESKDTMLTVVIGDLIRNWEEKKLHITCEHLEDAKIQSLVGETILDKQNELVIEVNHLKLKKMLPNIQFMNRVLKCNQEKSALA